MNPATFSSPPASACTLGTPGANGNDRITLNTYDNADEFTQLTTAYGTSVQANYATMTYSNDGLNLTILDAKNNLTTLTYNGFNRVAQVNFPQPTQGSNASNPSDFESFTYDANGNTLTDRKRDGGMLTFQYDALNRVTAKSVPGGATNVAYAYDLLSRTTSALYATSGQGVAYTYDALSRTTSETTSGLTLSYQYDIGGNLAKMTWPDGFYATYAYDALNRMTTVQDSSASVTDVTYSYDNLGRRSAVGRGNSTSTSYAYDGADRLTSLAQTLAGSGSVTFGASFNAARQILSRSTSNGLYISHPANSPPAYVTNGLNQYTTVAAVNFTYDSKGNLTSDGTRSFSYDAENRLLSETGGPQNLTLTYDPLGRLQQTVGSATTQFLYWGSALAAEYDGSGHVLRRYVQGADGDEPVVWYEGAGFADRRWLHTDNQGSIIAYSDSTGTAQGVYGYGPYGEPNAWAGSRYRYTGQIEIPEAQLYHYKARVYDPVLGRFLQTDPVGYASDVNAYAYVRNDPVNQADPSGLDACLTPCPDPIEEPPTDITVIGIPFPKIPQHVAEDILNLANLKNVGFNGLVLANFVAFSNTPNEPQRNPMCHMPSGESALAKALGVGSNSQEGVTVIGKLAVWAAGHAELAEGVEWALGPVGWGLAVAGETAQVVSDVSEGTRVDVAMVGATTRLVTPLAGAAVGAVAGGVDGFGFAAVPGAVAGLVVGAVAAPSAGRLAEANYLRTLGC
jgi:RHS repeat-associated protein